mgnify:CR=1 FL=1
MRGVSGVLIVTARCSDECRWFSQRGNGIMAKLPAVVSCDELAAFVAAPCEKCGQQVRVATEPWDGKVAV